MKFGLTADQYEYILNTVVKPIENWGGEVWCYGSRARGDHRKFSDLDLMIESSLSPEADLGAIQETLSNENFPYKVDLVKFSDFADAYKPGYLRDRVRVSAK